MILVGGWGGNAVDGLTVRLLYFILPLTECDWRIARRSHYSMVNQGFKS